MCTSFKNQMFTGMSSFLRKICFIQEHKTESKELSSAKKSSRGCTFFISHLLIHRRNDNVAWLAAFLKTLSAYEAFFFFPSAKFSHEPNIFTTFCLILPSPTLFRHSFINLDLHPSVWLFFSFIYDRAYSDHIYWYDCLCVVLLIIICNIV